jgi:hypothetical protein
MSIPRDYAALVKLLPTLRVFPDALGWTTLAAEEASKICLLGFEAQSGRWKCPPLPPELTRDNSLMMPLSAGWGERTPLGESEEKRATGTVRQQHGEDHVTPRPPVEAAPEHHKLERPTPQPRTEPDSELIEEAASKIVETLQRAGKPIPKRRLQQLLWRYPTFFTSALRILERRQHIFLEIR